VFVYFDNDVKVRAHYDAMSLAAKVAERRKPSPARGVGSRSDRASR